MATLELGVLISGRGSNLQAILDATSRGKLDARVRVVISNCPAAAGLERARSAGVPTTVVEHRAFPGREPFEHALVDALRQHGCEWVVLAGFMRVLTPTFLDAFPWRVINIHPALCPAFPGVDAQGQALAYGSRVTGCTVHLVDRGIDTGPILAQAVVPVLPEDTRESLAARLLGREHELLVTVLGWVAEGRVNVECRPSPHDRPLVRVRGVVPVLGLSS